MSEAFGISWIEGRPETAIVWRSPLMGFIAHAWLSLRAFRINPSKMRRIRASWWYHETFGCSPERIASDLERRLASPGDPQ